MKRLCLAALLVLSLAGPVSATTFNRSGTIALDPSSTLVNGGTAVLDATASGIKGGEYIIVRLACSQGGVVLFAQDQQGSSKVDPPLQWFFPLAWGNADPVDCEARTWYGTKTDGPIRPLTNSIFFTAT